MDEKYKNIYQRLLDEYRFDNRRFGDNQRRNWPLNDNEYEVFNTIEQVIENFRKKNEQYYVRPDAEFFLLLNFHQLIALPLLLDYSLESQFYPNLYEAISNDVMEILKGAIEEADDQEISGHSIVQSLSKRWDRLKTTEFNIWNRHDNKKK